MDRLVEAEDTDKNYQITIEDLGPKVRDTRLDAFFVGAAEIRSLY